MTGLMRSIGIRWWDRPSQTAPKHDVPMLNNSLVLGSGFSATIGAPPVLTFPTASGTSGSTASLSVTTDTANGTLYWVLSTSATPPTRAQVVAGNDSTGSGAAAHGSQTVSATGLQSISATGLAPSITYYAYYVHANVSGLQSNVAAATSFTTGGFATPVLTNFSALGTAPLVLDLSTTDYVAGLNAEWQIATDSGFTSVTQHIVSFFDGDSWARLDEAIGLTTPSGTFDVRARILRQNESGATTVTDQNGVTGTYDSSPWSNTYTDTISTSVAVLDASGTGKSPYLNISNGNRSWVHNNNVGALCASLASIVAQNAKWHTEISIDGWNSSGVWCCGITDGALDFSNPGFQTSSSATYPGNTAPGLTFQLGPSGTAITAFFNNTSTNINLPQAAAVGDQLILEVDEVAKTIKVYWYTLATTTVSSLLSTITLTVAPSSWYFFGGGQKGNAIVTTSDSGTWNPGNLTFKMTPTTGYGIYG